MRFFGVKEEKEDKPSSMKSTDIKTKLESTSSVKTEPSESSETSRSPVKMENVKLDPAVKPEKMSKSPVRSPKKSTLSPSKRRGSPKASPSKKQKKQHQTLHAFFKPATSPQKQ